VTEHPTAYWTAQQIVNAFSDAAAPAYLLRDRDQVYGQPFRHRVKGMGIEEVPTAPHSPWQNPFAERVMGSIRRECLNHVLVLERCWSPSRWPPSGSDALARATRPWNDSAGSGAPRSPDVLREELVDEGLIAKATPLGLAPHGVENLGIDPNRDQSPGSRPQGRPPHAPHRPELRGGRLRDVGEVNPGTPHRPPALCGSPGVR
jgi:hypothetical protein